MGHGLTQINTDNKKKEMFIFILIISFLLTSCPNPWTRELLMPLFPEYCDICVVTNTATCENAGVETRRCSEYPRHNESIRTVNALGHQGLTPAFAATCTTAGNNEASGTCTRGSCGQTFVGTVIDALEHDYNWIVTTAATYPATSTGTCIRCLDTDTRDTEIGDTGPAGGIIFYVDTGGFNVQESPVGTPSDRVWDTYTAHYLEAAPEDASPEMLRWALTGTTATTTNIGTSAAIGSGRRNTALMFINNDNSPAALACINYRGPNNFDDWFLSSQDEMTQLYYNKGIAGIIIPYTGINTGYWTSTESDSSDSSAFPIAINRPTLQYPSTGKTSSCYIRPIRAF